MKGENHDTSSNMVTRTFTNSGRKRVNIQLMHAGQKKCRSSGLRRPPGTGSPRLTSKPAAGMAAVSEKALALILWQPLQWHAIVRMGGALMRNCVSSQRQRPSSGSDMRLMRSRSCNPGNVDFADVIDAVAKHREALQTVADANRDVPRRISAEMSNDPVREYTPGEHLDPLAVLLDLELPRTRAHRILHRDDPDRPSGQRPIHRPQHAACHLPVIEFFAVIEPQDLELVKRLQMLGIGLTCPVGLAGRPHTDRPALVAGGE